MMKLVRESINFERTGDPLRSLDIGSRALIHKWFESVGLSPDRYTIDDKLNITVRGSLDLSGTQITKLPDNLTVRGGLDLRGTQIKELPDNLTVGGFLDLRGTQITKLPKNLKVKGTIYKDF